MDASPGRTVPVGHDAAGIDSMKLLDTAMRQDVAFVPGDPFFRAATPARTCG